jgi:hypothetical protein
LPEAKHLLTWEQQPALRRPAKRLDDLVSDELRLGMGFQNTLMPRSPAPKKISRPRNRWWKWSKAAEAQECDLHQGEGRLLPALRKQSCDAPADKINLGLRQVLRKNLDSWLENAFAGASNFAERLFLPLRYFTRDT